MWSKTLTRREFVDLFQNQTFGSMPGLRETRSLGAPSGEEIEVLWKFSPVEFGWAPTVAIVESSAQLDFLAWISTYLQTARPLTAFCRVVDRWTAEEMLRKSRPPSLGRFTSACLGLILGEAVSYVAGKREIRNISPQACYATFSYAVSRAVALDVPADSISELPRRWNYARSLIGSSQLPVAIDLLQNVWGVLANITRNESLFSQRHLFGPALHLPKWRAPHEAIVRCCEDLLFGELSQQSWFELVQFVPRLSGLRAELSGPREGRVKLLEVALEALRGVGQSERESSLGSFLIAYLASAISPGSLDHIQLLTPLLTGFPDVILWYGLLAGLHSRTGTISGVNGLGRRIIRELLREDDLLSAPSCDMALSELEILTPSMRSGSEPRFTSQSSLAIELVPCVNAIFRLSRSDDSTSAIGKDLARLWRDIDEEFDRFERQLDRLRRSSLEGSRDSSRTEKRGRKAADRS